MRRLVACPTSVSLTKAVAIVATPSTTRAAGNDQPVLSGSADLKSCHWRRSAYRVTITQDDQEQDGGRKREPGERAAFRIAVKPSRSSDGRDNGGESDEAERDVGRRAIDEALLAEKKREAEDEREVAGDRADGQRPDDRGQTPGHGDDRNDQLRRVTKHSIQEPPIPGTVWRARWSAASPMSQERGIGAAPASTNNVSSPTASRPIQNHHKRHQQQQRQERTPRAMLPAALHTQSPYWATPARHPAFSRSRPGRELADHRAREVPGAVGGGVFCSSGWRSPLPCRRPQGYRCPFTPVGRSYVIFDPLCRLTLGKLLRSVREFARKEWPLGAVRLTVSDESDTFGAWLMTSRRGMPSC